MLVLFPHLKKLFNTWSRPIRSVSNFYSTILVAGLLRLNNRREKRAFSWPAIKGRLTLYCTITFASGIMLIIPTAVLYQPGRPPQQLSDEQLDNFLPDIKSSYVPNTVSHLLGCAPSLVDILASGQGYVAYSVFDGEGETNIFAMRELAELTSNLFDLDNEDHILRGPVLIIRYD